MEGTCAHGGSHLTTNLINSQVVASADDLRYSLVVNFRAHNQAENYGYIALEGWLNAVVATEALRRAGPGPSREFSPSNHQGLHKVWLTRTEQGRWVPDEYSQVKR